jgi:rubrerythrin
MLKPEKDGRFYVKKPKTKRKVIHICSGCGVMYKSSRCPNCFPVNVQLERLVL